MNLVGKIFTVLIFVLSLVFMTFAILVYAAQKNWLRVVDNPKERATVEHPLGLSQELADARQHNKELTDANDKVNRDLVALKAEERQVRAKLETEKDRLEKEGRVNSDTIAKLRADLRQAVMAVKAIQEANDGLHKEVVGLRDDTQKAHPRATPPSRRWSG